MPATNEPRTRSRTRSEEHTSELQSLMRISYAVFCLKKKKNNEKKVNTVLKKKQNYNSDSEEKYQYQDTTEEYDPRLHTTNKQETTDVITEDHSKLNTRINTTQVKKTDQQSKQ